MNTHPHTVPHIEILESRIAPAAATFDLATLNGANGYAIHGASAGEDAGGSVSLLGDVNDDGIDDLRIGADGAALGVGACYVNVFSAARMVLPSHGGGCLLCNELIPAAKLQEEALSPDERLGQRYVGDAQVAARSPFSVAIFAGSVSAAMAVIVGFGSAACTIAEREASKHKAARNRKITLGASILRWICTGECERTRTARRQSTGKRGRVAPHPKRKVFPCETPVRSRKIGNSAVFLRPLTALP